MTIPAMMLPAAVMISPSLAAVVPMVVVVPMVEVVAATVASGTEVIKNIIMLLVSIHMYNIHNYVDIAARDQINAQGHKARHLGDSVLACI